MRREVLAPLQAVADRRSSWYLDLGVRHFCVGHDVGILYDWWAEQGRVMRSAMAACAPAGASVAAGAAPTGAEPLPTGPPERQSVAEQ